MRIPSDSELRLLLRRLSRTLPKRLEFLQSESPRNIRLGLDRVQRAVPSEQLWEGVHVAGTNGKGSICAYLSGLFTLAGTSHGRYTSPAFPEKRHGVVINGEAVQPLMYDTETAQLIRRYEKVLKGLEVTTGQWPGHLTPFEIETAAAFHIFNKLRVKYGIVEVGMGGTTDATNVMKNKAITIISKIGMDHAEYLGGTIREVAAMKAGIMVKDVPCVVDHTNEPAVMEVLERHAFNTGTPLLHSWSGDHLLERLDSNKWHLASWQRQNLLCAVTAYKHIFPTAQIDLNKLMESNPTLPGRLQTIRIASATQPDQETTALVDGAHNPLAMEQLALHVDSRLRDGDSPVTWVIGFSKSDTKPFANMLDLILRPQDNVAFVEYKQQDNEPTPVDSAQGRQWVMDCMGATTSDNVAPAHTSLGDALEWAREKSQGKSPVVISGSLYLIRDLFNLPQVLDKGIPKTRKIGSTVYKALARKKAAGEVLTDTEMAAYKETKHAYFDPRDRFRLKRRNKRRRELAAQGLEPGQVEEMITTAEGTTEVLETKSGEITTIAEVPLPADAPKEAEDVTTKVEDAVQVTEVRERATVIADEATTTPEEPLLPGASQSPAPVSIAGQETTESQPSATSPEQKQSKRSEAATKPKPKRKPILPTPFWRDPENTAMSLPDPSGKPSKRSLKRAVREARRKVELETAQALMLEGESQVSDDERLPMDGEVFAPQENIAHEDGLGPDDSDAHASEEDDARSEEERWAAIAVRRRRAAEGKAAGGDAAVDGVARNAEEKWAEIVLRRRA